MPMGWAWIGGTLGAAVALLSSLPGVVVEVVVGLRSQRSVRTGVTSRAAIQVGHPLKVHGGATEGSTLVPHACFTGRQEGQVAASPASPRGSGRAHRLLSGWAAQYFRKVSRISSSVASDETVILPRRVIVVAVIVAHGRRGSIGSAGLPHGTDRSLCGCRTGSPKLLDDVGRVQHDRCRARSPGLQNPW